MDENLELSVKVPDLKSFIILSIRDTPAYVPWSILLYLLNSYSLTLFSYKQSSISGSFNYPNIGYNSSDPYFVNRRVRANMLTDDSILNREYSISFHFDNEITL